MRDRPPIVDLPYRPSGSSPVETFTVADLVRRRPDTELRQHQRIEFELVLWCTNGHSRHEVDFETVPLAPGTILHISAGQVHRWMLDQPYEGHLILLRPLTVRTSSVRGPNVIELDADLESDLASIVDVLGRPSRSTPLSLRSLDALRDLLIARLHLNRRDLDVTTPLGELYVEFEALVAGSNPPPRSVAECARRIGCSTRTLARACHEAVGTPPKQLLDEAVALEAQRQLSSSSASVSEVAEALGFVELANFSRFFLRATGQTPTAFMAQLPGPTGG